MSEISLHIPNPNSAAQVRQDWSRLATSVDREIDRLDDGKLSLDQTTPQTVNGGAPVFSAGIVSGEDGIIESRGGNVKAIVSKSVDYTILNTDYTILVSGSSTEVTITLPAAPIAGHIVNVKCVDSSNAVTIGRNGNQIDGDSSDFDLIEDEVVTLQADSDGNWWII